MTQNNDNQTACTTWVGTSGYSFEDWVGTYYPKGTASRDMLKLYASEFDTVEVNFTYYRMPSARTTGGMVNKTPDGFQFFVKAHQSFTHQFDLSGLNEYLDGIAPMKEAGRLAGLLFQFPQSFKNVPGNHDYLARVADTFKDRPLAVEFRDNSWADDDVYTFMESHGLTFVCVDEPEVSTLFPRVCRATTDTVYLRFHSRDKDKWYRGPKERYDYLYSEGEMGEWLKMFESVVKRVRRMFVYFNNCNRGQAAENARAMKDILTRSGLPVTQSRVERGDTASLFDD